MLTSSGPLIHGICHFHGQWIPGDERGWRSRGQKRHSSGDYHDPPPPNEHAGLRRYVKALMKRPPIVLNLDECGLVGRAFIDRLQDLSSDVYVLACSPTHLHVLCTIIEEDLIRQLGRAKQYASLKLTTRRGQLWGERAKIVHIRDEEHAENVFAYICHHAVNDHAWLWRWDDPEEIQE